MILYARDKLLIPGAPQESALHRENMGLSIGTHIIVPSIGEKGSHVGQELLEVIAANTFSNERMPVARTGAMELDDEVEN